MKCPRKKKLGAELLQTCTFGCCAASLFCVSQPSDVFTLELTLAHMTSELFRCTPTYHRRAGIPPRCVAVSNMRCRLFPKKWRQGVTADLTRLVKGLPVKSRLRSERVSALPWPLHVSVSTAVNQPRSTPARALSAFHSCHRVRNTSSCLRSH